MLMTPPTKTGRKTFPGRRSQVPLSSAGAARAHRVPAQAQLEQGNCRMTFEAPPEPLI